MVILKQDDFSVNHPAGLWRSWDDHATRYAATLVTFDKFFH